MKVPFHIRLKEALELKKVKQSELSKKTGIGKSSISQYLSGCYEPKQQNIYLIAHALDINEAWLMGHNVPIEKTISFEKLNVTSNELEIIQKYRVLDEKGKHTFTTILDVEYNRCTSCHLTTIAAHNDFTYDPKEQELMKEDLKDMDSW